MNSFVYFVRIIDPGGAIKIGYAIDPVYRLANLNVWIPYELELLAMTPGERELERNIQDCFADAHIRGEWFKPIPRLLTAIEEIKAGKPVHEAIDLSKRLGNVLGMTGRQTMAIRGTSPHTSRKANLERRQRELSVSSHQGALQ